MKNTKEKKFYNLMCDEVLWGDPVLEKQLILAKEGEDWTQKVSNEIRDRFSSVVNVEKILKEGTFTVRKSKSYEANMSIEEVVEQGVPDEIGWICEIKDQKVFAYRMCLIYETSSKNRAYEMNKIICDANERDCVNFKNHYIVEGKYTNS